MFCGLSRISLFWLLLFQTGCWEQWRSSVLLQGHLWALPCLFFLEVLGLSAMDKTLGHSCQEAGPPPPHCHTHHPLLISLPSALCCRVLYARLIISWLLIYFLQCLSSLGLLLCRMQQTGLTVVHSQVSAPFYMDQGSVWLVATRS